MEENKKKINIYKIRDFLILLRRCLCAMCIGLIFGLAIKDFVYITVINGNSMNNTLKNKEIGLIINRFNKYGRGDIVVADITEPEGKSVSIIKRIIGMPGDYIQINDGYVYVNDEQIDEPYIPEEMNTKFMSKIMLGPGEYFLMGDNRNASYDSRLYGVVKYEQLRGELVFHIDPSSLIC